MFKSIKSKIIIMALCFFAVFSSIMLVIEVANYQSFKRTKIEICRNKVEKFEDLVNDSIEHFQDNSRSLALAAAAFYYFDKKNHNFIDFLVLDNFRQHYDHSVGGGIWFEPGVIDKNEKSYCAYASLKGNEIILDKNCGSEEYDYHNQIWYKAVKDSYSAKNKDMAFWSAPYYDGIGTKALMITAGAPIYDKEEKFIGLATSDWMLDTIIEDLDDLRPTPSSIVLLADKKSDFIITLRTGKEKNYNLTGQALSTIPWYNDGLRDQHQIKFNSVKYITFKKDYPNGMVIIVNIPEVEIYGQQRKNLARGVLLRFIFAFIFTLIAYAVLTKNINTPISVLIKATKELGRGNLDKKIKIDKPTEFAELATTFNKMTDELQDYIEKTNKLTLEKRQMEYDLNIAKQIQISSLPSVFPPFPDVVSLELFATMKTAKQVGGDFYDFYFVDKNHVLFTIADVSGKGIPAALFMMRAKSILKSMALSVQIPEVVMQKANNSICEHNEKGFFVTVGLGIIDILTGDVVYINAGHNPPIIKSKTGVTTLDVPSNYVVGVFEDVNFEVRAFKLEPLDMIFLYTDGVTEAANRAGEFYGTKRLLDVINAGDFNPKHVINSVAEDVSGFSSEVEQSDDITMVALTYLGNENLINKVHVPAEISEFEPFIKWLGGLCDDCGMVEIQKRKLLVAAEEIFVNIAYYAYPDKLKEKIQETTVTFRYIKPLDKVILTFTDSGIPYNPLNKEDPDITKCVDERTCGGLGIFMVKQMMDNVEYEYKNKQNILTIKCGTK